jgi:DNA-binding SARP family transcriptional activator
VQFRVLGPVEVVTAGGAVLSPGRRPERCLLGILVLDLAHAVPLNRRCDLLWDDEPPDHAKETVRTHIARLRSLLSRAGAAEHGVRLLAA